MPEAHHTFLRLNERKTKQKNDHNQLNPVKTFLTHIHSPSLNSCFISVGLVVLVGNSSKGKIKI